MGYMTIQIRTTQIPTIQILEKIIKILYLNKWFELKKNTYVDLIIIYKPLFSFLQNLKYFKVISKLLKITTFILYLSRISKNI